MRNIHLFTVACAVLLFSQMAGISALGFFSIFSNNIHGRLLTPDEGCGISKIANKKVVGGTEAKPGAYPWMALIGYAKNRFSCGGTLITSRHVLTAAHCIRSTLKFVRLGEHDLNSTIDGEHLDIKVVHIANHSKFNEDFPYSNDVAILTLERDVDFNDRIRPICLPLNNEFQNKSFADTNPFVAGWGRLKENGTRSNVLMQVQLPVIDYTKCERFAFLIYKYLGKVPSHEQFVDCIICAGNLAGGQDACKGDSGGPLMLPILQNGKFPMYQIGVISSGVGCARKNFPGLYTRIQRYMDWIQKEIDQKL